MESSALFIEFFKTILNSQKINNLKIVLTKETCLFGWGNPNTLAISFKVPLINKRFYELSPVNKLPNASIIFCESDIEVYYTITNEKEVLFYLINACLSSSVKEISFIGLDGVETTGIESVCKIVGESS